MVDKEQMMADIINDYADWIIESATRRRRDEIKLALDDWIKLDDMSDDEIRDRWDNTAQGMWAAEQDEAQG